MRRRLQLIGLLLAATIGPVPAGAGDPGELVVPLLRARDAGALGEVSCQAWAEPSRPGGSPAPDRSVSVMLLPYSAELEAQLDAVKSGQRDSLKDFADASGRIEAARTNYESALRFAGGGELIRGDVTDDQGRIRLTGLPAGDWLLVAWKDLGHSAKRYRLQKGETRKYPDVPTSVGYSMVTYWRLRVTVRAKEASETTLTDRNVWITALKEERRFPDQTAPTGPKRR
jgi:hypothetical protein